RRRASGRTRRRLEGSAGRGSFPVASQARPCRSFATSLAPGPRQLHGQDRRKRAGDDLSTGLAEHEADGGDELAIAANDGLIPLHELIGVESKRLRFDLVPAVSEQDVLDFVHLNAKRHVRTSGMTTLIKERSLHKKRRPLRAAR